MRQIKFRGKSAIGTVYGFYVEREGRPYIVNEVGTWVSVDRESVKQYVTTIKGIEIYDGDIAPDETGRKVRWAEIPLIYRDLTGR